MATRAQLEAEPWWGREIVPEALKAGGARLAAHYGQPATSVGTKGNYVHLRGAHRSQEWIKNSGYCTDRSYTVQSGLTAVQARHVAGLDFTPGSTARMIEICRRLDEATRSGRLEQVREWYGNVDGDRVVDGWDNVRDRVASSDSSHLWHVHVTFDRRLVADPAAVDAVIDVMLGEETLTMLGLKKGARGPAVVALQVFLWACGVPEKVLGARDGVYGPMVAAAVVWARQSVGSTATNGDEITPDAYEQIHRAHILRWGKTVAGAPGPKGDPGEQGPPGPQGDAAVLPPGTSLIVQ